MSTILIVDDEADLREAIAFDFKRRKFNVITAASGHEAMKLIESQAVDIVLSDVRMPDGDGIQLLDWIKERNTLMPVVMFITAFADISVEEAYDKGAEAVFAKPFDRKMLMAAVERAIQPTEQKFGRRNERVDANIPITLKINGQEVESKALNLGRGGIFVALDKGLPEPQAELEFDVGAVPGFGGKISGRGVVRWVRKPGGKDPPGFGMEFLQLDRESIGLVVQYLNLTKTKSYIPIK